MSPPPTRDDRRIIAAWCLYDWANSAFTTLVVTFIYATYFTQAIAPNDILGTAWWSRAVALTAVVVGLSSPVLGALADRGGLRRRLLITTTTACVVATAMLAYVVPGPPRAPLVALTLFVIANVAFELGMVFYNSLLPVIASPRIIGRVSGYGWALGYGGGLVCLVIALAGFVGEQPWFGMSTAEGFNIRATNLLAAGWFALFSLPFFFTVRESPRPGARVELLGAFRELARVAREAGRYRDTIRFLVARLLYNDGLITIFAFGGIYAMGTFDMSFADIVVFGIVLNVAAGLGAWIFGFVDDRIGGRRTVLWSVAALAAATALAAWAPSRLWLWVAGVLIGIFAGPNQAASRSLMGRFVPPERESEFYGFYAFSGKFTSFLGPLFLGAATQAAGTQRAGVATLLVFFVAGGLMLWTVNERRGIAAAGRSL